MRINLKAFTVLVAAGLFLGQTLWAADYQIDTPHTDVGFVVKHLGLSKVRGAFSDITGKISFDPNQTEKSQFFGVIKAKSINTQNEKRDAHLRGADFFDVEKFPEIRFKSTKIRKSEDGLVVSGKLTIHGVTQDVEFPVEILGPVVGPYGKNRIGFEGRFVIDRRDYGLTWSKASSAGNLVVANEVEISISAQGIEMAK